jgi:hypothetical protein
MAVKLLALPNLFVQGVDCMINESANTQCIVQLGSVQQRLCQCLKIVFGKSRCVRHHMSSRPKCMLRSA